MKTVPENTSLGEMSPLTTYGYFDGPYLYSAVNSTGQVFIALAVDETNTHTIFLYVPVSNARLAAFERGAVGLRTIFANPESKVVYKVSIAFVSGEEDAAEPILASSLTDDMLPSESATLPHPLGENAERVVLFSTDEAKRVAVGAQQDLLRLGLKFGSSTTFDAPLGEFSEVLATFQDAANALGQWTAGDPSNAGRIPNRVLEELSVHVTGAFAASVGLDIMFPSRADLFTPSLASSTMRKLVALLNAEGDELETELQELNKRSVTKYREFLESIVGSNISLDGTMASAFDDFARTVRMDRARAKNALAIATRVEQQESETVTFRGALTGLNSRTRSFEVRDNAGSNYRGRVSANAPDYVLHSTIEEIYDITLLITTEVSSITGEERKQNTLLDLQRPPRHVNAT